MHYKNIKWIHEIIRLKKLRLFLIFSLVFSIKPFLHAANIVEKISLMNSPNGKSKKLATSTDRFDAVNQAIDMATKQAIDAYKKEIIIERAKKIKENAPLETKTRIKERIKIEKIAAEERVEIIIAEKIYEIPKSAQPTNEEKLAYKRKIDDVYSTKKSLLRREMREVKKNIYPEIEKEENEKSLEITNEYNRKHAQEARTLIPLFKRKTEEEAEMRKIIFKEIYNWAETPPNKFFRFYTQLTLNEFRAVPYIECVTKLSEDPKAFGRDFQIKFEKLNNLGTYFREYIQQEFNFIIFNQKEKKMNFLNWLIDIAREMQGKKNFYGAAQIGVSFVHILHLDLSGEFNESMLPEHNDYLRELMRRSRNCAASYNQEACSQEENECFIPNIFVIPQDLVRIEEKELFLVKGRDKYIDSVARKLSIENLNSYIEEHRFLVDLANLSDSSFIDSSPSATTSSNGFSNSFTF